jgi:transcription elongation factor Elf1
MVFEFRQEYSDKYLKKFDLLANGIIGNGIDTVDKRKDFIKFLCNIHELNRKVRETNEILKLNVHIKFSDNIPNISVNQSEHDDLNQKNKVL